MPPEEPEDTGSSLEDLEEMVDGEIEDSDTDNNDGDEE